MLHEPVIQFFVVLELFIALERSFNNSAMEEQQPAIEDLIPCIPKVVSDGLNKHPPRAKEIIESLKIPLIRFSGRRRWEDDGGFEMFAVRNEEGIDRVGG
jgi:hypothetical protein